MHIWLNRQIGMCQNALLKLTLAKVHKSATKILLHLTHHIFVKIKYSDL